MAGCFESESRWGGDSAAEWTNLAVEATGIGIWEFDLDEGTGFISERCAEIMGYAQIAQNQSIRFDEWLSLINTEDRERIIQACSPDGDGELQMLLQFIGVGGVIRQAWVRGRAFFSVSHVGDSKPVRKAVRLLGIVHDLSDRRLYDRALAQAEAANRSKDQFLAILSHQLRTPLNAILGWAFILKQDSVKPEVQKEGISVIERNARAQSDLIADLLDLSRIVAGKLRLEPKELNFLSCLKSALEKVSLSAGEKGVRIVNLVDSALTPGISIFGDPIRLEQVIFNLLVNAVQFTPLNGTVTVSLELDNAVMRLKVADTGIGIEPELISGLFNWFSESEGSRRKRGLGLGLTISRHIVELHEGKIFAMSEGTGRGATFTVELPIASVQKPFLPENDALPNHREKSVRTLEDVTVVVVDDNPDARGFIDQVLKYRGARVISVETGEKAIQAVQRYHPDVVLCDLMMPEMDGHAVLRHIRTLEDELAKDVPVVALTALAGAENRLKTQQAGFQIHLDKPIDPPRLIQAIQTVVRTRAGGNQSEFKTAQACG